MNHDKKKILSRFSSEELLRELSRRLRPGGGSCWSCHSDKPTYQCMNEEHQTQAIIDSSGGEQGVW